MPRVLPAWAVLLGGAWLLGCSQDVQLAKAHAKAHVSSGSGGKAPASSGPREGDCTSPMLDLARADAGAGASCPSIAAQTFRYALCTCGDATFTNSLATDAFDSAIATYAPGQDGASVGIDGQLNSSGALDVAGSLIATGTSALPITASPFHVAGNFAANGDVIMTGVDASFGRDMQVNGEILAVGASVHVARDVVQTPGHAGADGVTVAGRTLSRDFALTPPCACADAEILDVAAAVRGASSANDNAALGLARDALYATDRGALVLPCGRFIFDGGATTRSLALTAHARTAIFIDGDLAIGADFQPDLGAGGELDVLVSGDLVLGAGIAIGTAERPAALRFYVAGSGAIVSTGPLGFSASLYAPRAAWLTSAEQTLYGALFVESYSAAGAQRLHYDRALLRSAPAGSACSAAPGADNCGADAECAAPFLCSSGHCSPGSD